MPARTFTGLSGATYARRIEPGPLERAMLTGRATGSPVHGYRSRKGRTVPGFRPLITGSPVPARPSGVPIAPAAFPAPVTVADVRTMAAFTPTTAVAARRIIRSATYLSASQSARLTDQVRTRTVWRSGE